MMMKNLIKALGFILAVAGPSIVMAAPSTNSPQGTTTTDPNKIWNKVCIESPQTETKCANVPITIIDDGYACLSISANNTVIPSNGKVTLTCRASDATKQHTFAINCGNGHIEQGVGTSSFSYTCHYDDITSPYYVSCIVDEKTPTNPSCNTVLNYGLPEYQCGDNNVDPGEQCDLGGAYQQLIPCSDSSCSSQGDSDYYCKNCTIVHKGSFLYEPAECRYSDTPISVMNNEYVPYWWKLFNKNTQEFTSKKSDCTIKDSQEKTSQEKTLILDIPGSKNEKERVRCYFNVYNGLNNQTPGSDGKTTYPIATFVEDCRNFDENYSGQKIFDYFEKNHHWNEGNNNKKPDGVQLNTVQALTNNHSTKEFGEYKLVLEKVEYQVCDTTKGERVEGKKYGAICEVNFAVTKPYIMQVSTFGVNPVGTNGVDFLKDYYDMYGDNVLGKTDLNSVIKTDNSDYAVDNDVNKKFEEFKDKYEKLAVSVDLNSTVKNSKNQTKQLKNVFDGNVTSLKKVPGKSIYFLKGNGTLKLSQDNIEYLTTAFTLIVEGMDVEIEGNFLKYAMIVTNQQMSFKDAGKDTKNSSSCADGGQVVQGIYVALGGFKAADENLKNTDPEGKWCPWGGLHVKGVLIGDRINNISNSKRSNLNSWFNASSASESVVKKARRETIIKGASLLIEYSPSLWKTLPPGAEIFTENLEVYRK